MKTLNLPKPSVLSARMPHQDDVRAVALVTWKNIRATVTANGRPIIAAEHPVTQRTFVMSPKDFSPLSWQGLKDPFKK